MVEYTIFRYIRPYEGPICHIPVYSTMSKSKISYSDTFDSTKVEYTGDFDLALGKVEHTGYDIFDLGTISSKIFTIYITYICLIAPQVPLLHFYQEFKKNYKTLIYPEN